MKSLTTKFKVHNYRNNNEQVVQSPFDPNQAMRFDDKTDEEFVNSSNYKTNLTIEELISNPEPKRKNKKGKIPRRMNKWIIYRKDKNTLFKGSGLIAEVITEKIREMWAKEPEEVKEFYAALSRLAVKKHIKIYGQEYKYRPGPYKKRNKKTKKISSLKESSPNISESMNTTSSTSSPSQSMQIPSDIISGLSFFPTPESIPDSPATSSVASFDDYDDSLGLAQAFPPLSAISRSSIPNFDDSLDSMQVNAPPSLDISIPNFGDSLDSMQANTPSLLDINFIDSLDSMQANEPLFNISYSGVDANILKFPEPVVDTNISMNAATTPHSALDKLLSTFTEEQKQLYSKVVQLPIEHDHDLYYSKENSQDDNFLTNSQIEHQELLNANTYQYQTNMVYNEQCADSTIMDNNDVLSQQYDWLLFDDTIFDYLARDPREPSL